MALRGSWLSVCLLLVTCLTAAAEERPDLKALLERRVVEPERVLEEVQVFTESRVAPLPDVKTADEWNAHAARLRQQVLEQVVFRGAAAGWRDAETGVEWLGEIAGGPGYRIRKLRYEALPGLWIPALLYGPEQLTGKVPVVMNVNGHDGKGKAADYKQIRCINQAKRGMLALNVEWLGMGQLRAPDFGHYRMNQLDLCGTSGLAPFYLAMKRGLDVLLAHEHADPERVAVAGLSGGGWQTIVISALDERVTLANPVAGYSSFLTRARNFSDLGDSEQTPVDLGSIADYHHLTAMRAPRPTLLTYNANDQCCFKADHALPPLMETAQPIFALYGREQALRSHINSDPGTHNFELDNRQQLYRMLGDFFFADDEDFDWQEIPSDSEVKSDDDLHVALPDENANFHSLAMSLSHDLPRSPELPDSAAAAREWQSERRQRLAGIVRSEPRDASATAVETIDGAGTLRATTWRLRIGDDWTVPAVELVRDSPQMTSVRTTIVLADGGRTAALAQIDALLDDNRRVLAIDPFYLGESKITQRDFLFGLLVSTVGRRPLGVQADQIAAIARWAEKEYDTGPVSVTAIGPRTSLMALVAAVLEPKAIGGLELHESFGSLREIIEQNKGVNEAPELFCFGLLEQFDILQLAALAAPRPVTFAAPSERVREEISPLAAWYGLLGSEHDPLASEPR